MTKVVLQPGPAEIYTPKYKSPSVVDNVEILAVVAHTEDLTALIKAALRRGFTPIWASELWDAMRGKSNLPTHPFMICVDDGRLGMWSVTYPSILALGVKANFFLASDFLYYGLNAAEVDNSLVVVNQQPMTWANARTMRDSGLIEFQNHSRHHSFVPPKVSLADEVTACTAAIQTELGTTPIAIAWPNGIVTPAIADAARTAGMKFGFDFQPSSNSGSDRFSTLGDGLYTLNRIGALDATAFTWVRQRSLVNWEWDWTGNRNVGNQLGFWSFSSAAATVSATGDEINVNSQVSTNAESAITADYFHVLPSDVLHFKGWIAAANHTTGNSGVRIKQYDAAKGALADIDLITHSASTPSSGFVNRTQDVTLAAGCRFVRLEAWTDAACNGQLRMKAHVLRVY